MRIEIENHITQAYQDENGFMYFRFCPTLTKLFYGNMFPFKNDFKQKLRFIIELMTVHYHVYYMTDKNRNILSYCVIHESGKGRYSALPQNAYIIGPYYTPDERRGRGYATKLVDYVLRIYKDYPCYDWIWKGNKASQIITEKLGGQKVAEIRLTKYSRKLEIVSANGDYTLYKFIKA